MRGEKPHAHPKEENRPQIYCATWGCRVYSIGMDPAVDDSAAIQGNPNHPTPPARGNNSVVNPKISHGCKLLCYLIVRDSCQSQAGNSAALPPRNLKKVLEIGDASLQLKPVPNGSIPVPKPQASCDKCIEQNKVNHNL